MKYLELREALKSFTLFSIREIKKVDNHFHRRRLNDWQEKGYIKKLIRGYYIFSDLELNENLEPFLINLRDTKRVLFFNEFIENLDIYPVSIVN